MRLRLTVACGEESRNFFLTLPPCVSAEEAEAAVTRAARAFERELFESLPHTQAPRGREAARRAPHPLTTQAKRNEVSERDEAAEGRRV